MNRCAELWQKPFRDGLTGRMIQLPNPRVLAKEHLLEVIYGKRKGDPEKARLALKKLLAEHPELLCEQVTKL